jgi:hypothetical protein
MLTLEQLITEATAFPDADKTILIEKLVESMAGPIDQDMLREGIQNAQKRLAEIESGAVQTIPGEIAIREGGGQAKWVAVVQCSVVFLLTPLNLILSF